MRSFSEIKAHIRVVIERILKLRVDFMTHPQVEAIQDHLNERAPFFGKHFFKFISAILITFLLCIILHIFVWRAPSPFPEHALVMVERGMPMSEVTAAFEKKGVVRSGFWLRVFIHLFGGERRVVAGDYYFPESQNVMQVASTLGKGEFGLFPLRVTIPEGLSSHEIAELLAKELPALDAEDFVDEVEDKSLEGYLFPDTYFFMPNADAEDVILTMRENFARQVEPYATDVEKFKKPMYEVIVMASILEAEGNTIESKRMIADILWRRLRLKMPLQVDAPFVYYNGKNSYTLTKEDLQEDHEYNTYVNKGLPPTAITNPGIDSIRAAITPTPNKYLFFLSDKSGDLHYALDFEGHKHNRELYLDSY